MTAYAQQGIPGIAGVLARQRAYKRQHAERIAAERAAKHLAAYRQDPIVNRCKQCGATWCPLPAYHRKLRSQFCGPTCRNRHHHRVRRGPWQRQLRAQRGGGPDLGLSDRIIAHVRHHPWSVTSEIAQAVGGRPDSLRTTLSALARAGKLVRQGDRRGYRYAVSCDRSAAGVSA